MSTFLHTDRIVIGTDSDRAAEVLREPSTVRSPTAAYYQNTDAVPGCCSTGNALPPLLHVSTKAAELIKHASNAFLAVKISFINVVANICEAVGADVEQVARGIGMDERIGPRFLKAGVGYGGSCFPKDVAAFRYVAEQFGIPFGMLSEVEKINAEQKLRFFRRGARLRLWTFRGKKLGVLGLSFKGGTDDIRDSPAIEIVALCCLRRAARSTPMTRLPWSGPPKCCRLLTSNALRRRLPTLRQGTRMRFADPDRLAGVRRA